MKKQIILLLALTGACLLLLSGCVAPNPQHQTGDNNPPFIPDTPRIEAVAAQARALNDATAPLNPYSNLIALGITACSIGATFVSGIVATVKSKSASKAKAQSDIMAQGIVKAGDAARTIVLEHASVTPHFAAIANHINDATP